MEEGGKPPGSRIRLGDFEIEKKVGEGGMGTVFKARQISLDRIVALKVLPKSFAENPEFVERFRREARAAASLLHPNVVQVYSVGEERGVPYFAMEFVDGTSLDAALRSGRQFELRESVELALGVARALEAAHEKGLVHRDIKPANIMLDRKDNVKVTDFGLAKPSSGSLDITQPGLVVGTPTYMSPEQGAGEDVDTTSDIYSLGVVLYEMITGRVPFSSDNVGTIIYKHLHEAPEPPSAFNENLPSQLEAVVLKCLGKHPEDRFQTPAALVGALSSPLKGETRTDPTIMLSGAGSAPAVSAPPGPSDVTLPTPVPAPRPSDVTQPTPAPGARRSAITPAPYMATPSTLMQPVAPRTSRGAFTGLFLAVLLLGAGGAGYYYWPELREMLGIKGPGPVGPVGPGPGPGPVGPGPANKLYVLDLEPLKDLLPAGSTVELAAPQGAQKIDLSSPEEFKLPAGTYKLSFSRKGYEKQTWELKLSASGVAPKLDAEHIAAKPSPELVGPYVKAEELLAKKTAKDATAALEHLKKVAEIDPAFREIAKLREQAQGLLAAAEKRWQSGLAKAQELASRKRWGEAKPVYQRVVSETPVGHRLRTEAISGVNRANDMLAKVAGLVTSLRGHLSKGEYDKASGITTELKLVSEETTDVKALVAKLAKGSALWKKANGQYNAGSFGSAAKVFAEVLAVSPECTAARDLKARCEKLVRTTNKIERAVSAAEGQLKAGDHAACLKALDALAGENLGDYARKVADFRARAQQGLETGKIESQLTRFDSAFAGLDYRALKKEVLDFRPESATFRRTLESRLKALGAAGIEISSWKHKLDSVKVTRSAKGEPTAATAISSWSFELGIPDLSKKLTGSLPLQLSFKRMGNKWLLAAAAPAGKTTVRSGGSGPAKARISGKVTAVDGKILTLDRGRDHGVARGMIFNVFQEARVVHLPLTGEKIFVEERPVAVAEVIEVAARTCRCALAPETSAAALKRIKAGMPAALSTTKTVSRTFPVVAGISTSRATAAAGESLTVKLDVKPVRNVLVTYKWFATGGILSAAHTATPSVSWRAPAQAGDYEITATTVTAAGRSEKRSIKLKSSGTPAAASRAYKLEATVCESGVFEDCRDLAFDSRGFAYALDARRRCVVLFDPQFRPMGSSDRFDAAMGLARIAAHDGRLYCLDTKNMAVKSFNIGQTIQFAKPAAKDIGGRGVGNGKLQAPVDLAFSPSGELYVLDAPIRAPSVQVFDSRGGYLQSFGSASGGTGRLEQPVAIAVDRAGVVHVLDAARRKVVSFKSGRPLRAFTCGAKTAKLTDLTYDVSSDALVVLDAASGQASVYSTAGRQRTSVVIGSKSGLASLRGATRIAANSAGTVISSCGAGKYVSRFSTAGRFLGTVGGSPLSAMCRIAAGPDEKLLALDTSTSIVRVFDGHGWLLSEFGGRKTLRKGADLVCDASGTVYLLDAGTQNVKAFDLSGGPRGTYGKKGKPPEGMEDVVDVATDGRKILAVLCYEPQNSIFHYSLGARGRPQVFPEERKSTPSPKGLAVDSGGRTFLLTRKGQVLVWDANKKNLGQWPVSFKQGEDLVACAGRVFVLDSRSRATVVCDAGGAEHTRIKLPKACTRPTDLAASDYEVVYVYDAGSKSVLKYRARR